MSEALHVLFHEVERAQAFPTPIIEVRDNVGVKRFKFYPDYADQLTLAMHLVSSTLNDYLMAARKPKTFSFGRSSHYDMEFSDLVYRRWATRLVLESFERRILARIQLAKEAIESFITESEFKPGTGPPRIASPAFSTSTVFAADVLGMIAADQATTRNGSPQAEDQRWALQLQQDVEVPFSSMVAATARNLTQNLGLMGTATNPPPAPNQLLTEEPMRDVTTAFAELELENPQPTLQAQMTQDRLNEWNASQQLVVQPEVTLERSDTVSSLPLNYYMSEPPDLRQFYQAPVVEFRVPSRTYSLPPEPYSHHAKSRPVSRASGAASLPDIYSKGYRASNPPLSPGKAPPVSFITRPSSAPVTAWK